MKKKAKKEQFTKFDAAEYLKTEAHITAYLNAVFEEEGNDPAFIAKAFGTVAKARGMSKIAKKVGMSRSGLYQALSGEGNPEFATMLKVMQALGVEMRVA